MNKIKVESFAVLAAILATALPLPVRAAERALLDVELEEARAPLQVAEIREQVAQAKRGVNIFRIEGG